MENKNQRWKRLQDILNTNEQNVHILKKYEKTGILRIHTVLMTTNELNKWGTNMENENVENNGIENMNSQKSPFLFLQNMWISYEEFWKNMVWCGLFPVE